MLSPCRKRKARSCVSREYSLVVVISRDHIDYQPVFQQAVPVQFGALLMICTDNSYAKLMSLHHDLIGRPIRQAHNLGEASSDVFSFVHRIIPQAHFPALILLILLVLDGLFGLLLLLGLCWFKRCWTGHHQWRSGTSGRGISADCLVASIMLQTPSCRGAERRYTNARQESDEQDLQTLHVYRLAGSVWLDFSASSGVKKKIYFSAFP
mmetsp:Transcript_29722/g.64358  ORF Transcript_29722/g.64358 Transcript_29722/m.64358 type:complete len:209 (+) Transcript_29722:330-956(+)